MSDPEDQLRRYAEAAARSVPRAPLPGDEPEVLPAVPARRPRLLATAAVVALLLGVGAVAMAANGNDGEDVAVEPGTEDLPHGLARCTEEPAKVTAPPDLYRDEPVYTGNEMPVEAVMDWAQARPGFEELWIDRERNGWITVAFSRDADRRQEELAQAFPGVGVVAVAVDWTQDGLSQQREDARQALEAVGISAAFSASVPTGLVEVHLAAPDPAAFDALAPFAGPRLCVRAPDPDDVVPAGDQPRRGDGWRLLGEGRTGASYRTGIATTAEQYAALWTRSGLDGEPAPVDFETEVAIWFGAVYGSGCDIRLDGVAVDDDAALVHADLVIPEAPAGCSGDANPKTYVVAVERQRLPAGAFAIQLGAEDPPQGAPEERTRVEADLRPPGAVATDEEIRTGR